MKEKFAFVAKVMAAHVLTYVICGMLAMTLFDYQGSVEAIGMRGTDDLMVQLAPLFQIARGVLFGIVLWLLRPAYLGRRHGWLVVWATVAILGIFNTPATSPGSIEALIYLEPTGAPWNTSVGGTLEEVPRKRCCSALLPPGGCSARSARSVQRREIQRSET